MLVLPNNLFSVAELAPKWSKKPVKESQRPRITSSRDVYNLFVDFYPDIDMYESFWVILCSRGNRIKGISNISIGSVAGTVADPKKIFQTALLANASSIIAIHNHPSGNLQPSQKDIQITEKIKKSGLVLDIPLLDHLIFSEDSYFSFADEGIL